MNIVTILVAVATFPVFSIANALGEENRQFAKVLEYKIATIQSANCSSGTPLEVTFSHGNETFKMSIRPNGVNKPYNVLTPEQLCEHFRSLAESKATTNVKTAPMKSSAAGKVVDFEIVGAYDDTLRLLVDTLATPAIYIQPLFCGMPNSGGEGDPSSHFKIAIDRQVLELVVQSPDAEGKVSAYLITNGQRDSGPFNMRRPPIEKTKPRKIKFDGLE